MNPLNNSWIKLPRTFTSWRWYHDSKMVHVFLYFLLQANVKKTDYLSYSIPRSGRDQSCYYCGGYGLIPKKYPYLPSKVITNR